MTAELRLARVLDRLATGTRALGIRANDADRAKRNGNGQRANLNEAVTRLEAAADDLWKALESK